MNASGLFRNKTVLAGGVLLLVFVVMAVGADWLAPYDPVTQALRERLRGPGAAHWMGTDNFGRDIFSRVIWGARISLEVGVLAVAVGGSIGITIGLIAGFFGGWLDIAIMRLVDAMLSLPTLLVAIVIVAITGTGGLFSVVAAVGLANAPRFARLMRAEVLSLKTLEYVTAAAALGASRMRQMFRHILPNAIATILVLSTLRIGEAVMAEAALSFLGFGPQQPNITWGAMIAEGRSFLRAAPWIPLFPAAAIMLLVVSFNLIGDGLLDVIDPKRRPLLRRA